MKYDYELKLYKPDGRHKSYRLYKRFAKPPMERVESPVLEQVNKGLKAGELSPREAERLAEEVLNAQKRARAAEAGLPVSFFAEDNMKVLHNYVTKVYRLRETSQHSKTMRENDLKRAVGLLGEVPIRVASHEELVTRLKKAKLEAKIYNRMAGCLNTLLKYLKRDFIIHAVDSQFSDITVWSLDEVRGVVAALPPNEKLLCLTAFATGMRWGECIGLQARFIKTNPRTDRTFVWVDRQWNRTVGKYTDPKRGSKRDTLIVKEFIDPVRQWAKLDEASRFEASQPALPEHSFHTFRHSYATYLLQKGVSLSLVARFLGNGLKVTEDYYAAYTFGDDLQLPDGF